VIEIREFASVHDDELSSAWERLTGRGACPNIFMTYPWVASWAEHQSQSVRPSILVGHERGDPVGIAPLFRDTGGAVGFPISSNPMSLRGEFITGPERAAAFGAAVIHRLLAEDRPVVLRGVPERSATLAATSGVLRVIARRRVGRTASCVEVGPSWERYLHSRPRKTTHEWERKIRRIERAGDVRIARLEGQDAVELVRSFVDIEARSWKEEAGSSIGRRGMGPFYEKVARLLSERGWFRPFWLELDGRPIAFIYGFVFGDTYWAIKTSYDRAHAALAPGTALFHEAVRDAFRCGLRRFDFVGHDARWTKEWATGRIRHYDIGLYPVSPSGAAAYVRDRYWRPGLRRLGLGRREET
jgi:CelD/BcsL family acetyltransferase involved in cellulose biosynthesis